MSDAKTSAKRPWWWPKNSWDDQGDGRVWIDHHTVKADDLPSLQRTRHLTLWNVKVPSGFYGSLPDLEFLDIRGGTTASLDPIAEARDLRALVVNQVRGLTNLDAIARMTSLRYLSLYGLAHVERLPSLAAWRDLRRADIGQMQNLADIAGLADAPALEELFFYKKLAIKAESMKPFQGHARLRAFSWDFEDVPVSQALPVLDALPLEKVKAVFPDEWIGARGSE